LNDEAMRAFAMIAAGILLNWGLFFVLAIFAPLVVGIACGYILHDRRYGILTGVVSAVFSYWLIFTVTGYGVDLMVLGSALLIMGIIGGVGGLLGASIHKRISKSSSQVSTIILPGE
jgi:hypothetical protein